MRRDHDRDMMIGIAGILAGATLTVAGQDFMESRTSYSSPMEVANDMRLAMGLEVTMPCFDEHSAAGITWRVVQDVAAFITGEDVDDQA